MRMNHYTIPPFSTILWRPTSPTYEAAVSREMYELFGTNNHTTASMPVPSVCLRLLSSCNRVFHHLMYTTQNGAIPVAKDHIPGVENVSRICSHFATTLPIPHLRQVTRAQEAAQLVEAHSHTTVTQIAHTCSSSAPCEWIDGGNIETCEAQIKCASVSTHFRNSHGIRNMNKNALIGCFWRGCRKVVGRKNFVRHIHECHLGHPR